MTSIRELLSVPLFLSALWTGQALADQVPQAPAEAATASVREDTAAVENSADSPDRLAWQRVGLPEREA